MWLRRRAKILCVREMMWEAGKKAAIVEVVVQDLPSTDIANWPLPQHDWMRNTGCSAGLEE